MVAKDSQKSQRLQASTTTKTSNDNFGSLSSSHNGPTTITINLPDTNHSSYNRIPILNKKCAANESGSHACQLFESCTSSFLQLLEEIEYKLMSNSSSPQPLDDVVNVRIAFYVGFVLGSIISSIILCVLQQLCVCMCRRLSERVPREPKQRNYVYFDWSLLYLMNGLDCIIIILFFFCGFM